MQRIEAALSVLFDKETHLRDSLPNFGRLDATAAVNQDLKAHAAASVGRPFFQPVMPRRVASSPAAQSGPYALQRESLGHRSQVAHSPQRTP